MLTYFEGKSQIVMQQNYGRKMYAKEKMYATELMLAYFNDEAKIVIMQQNHVKLQWPKHLS